MFTEENSQSYASETKLVVTAKKQLADGVVSLDLAHPAGRRLPDWTPGSHIDVVLPSGINRQYSLCGDRWDAHTYRIAVLHERDGRGGSDFIHRGLTEGMTLALGGPPRNNFRLVPSEKYVFIAGGIGITPPLLPMIQQAHMMGADWRLVYLGRSRRTMAFLDELAVYGDRVVIMPKDQVGPVAHRISSGGDPKLTPRCTFAVRRGFLPPSNATALTGRPASCALNTSPPSRTAPPSETLLSTSNWLAQGSPSPFHPR